MKSFTTARRLGSCAVVFAASALVAVVAGPTGASAQSVVGTSCSNSFPPTPPNRSFIDVPSALSQPIGGAVGASNAVSSVIGTMNTSFIAQGNAFVAGLPNATPDETSGGIWGRAIGGRVETQATGTFTGSISGSNAFNTLTTSGQIGCNSDIRMDYGGFQLGQDIARLNIGGNGATLHVGVTGGYAEANAQDLGGSNFTGNFQVPFVGMYAAYTNGRFFADILGRADFYQMNLFSPDAALANQRLNALGGTVSGSAGYRFDLGNNWFFEPSASGIYSRVSIDTLGLPGGFGNSNNPFFLPPATLAFSPNVSILGRLGARVGTTVNALNITWQPFATASVWHEFAGNTTATYTAPPFVNFNGDGNAVTGSLSNSRVGTYGQYSIGVAAQAAGSPLLGYLRIDAREGSNIESVGFNAGLRYNFDPNTGPLRAVGIFKAKAPLAAPLYDWTGFYAGAFTGAGWGSNDWSFPALGTNANPRMAGMLGGGDIGYNKQFGSWVLGVEGDVAATNAKGGVGCIPNGFDINVNSNGLPVQNCNNDLRWVATATAKVGYAWDRVLVYGKAGGAWTDNQLNASCNGDAFFPQGGCVPSNILQTGIPGVQNATGSTSQFGWTVGAGFELVLTPSWSAKAEYDYMNFGSKNVVLSDATLVNFKQDFNQVKVGLNYHFGKDDVVVAAAAMPYKAKAPPVAPYNWTGVYLGVAGADRMSVASWNTTGIIDPAGSGLFLPPDPTTTPSSFFSANAQARLYAGYNWQLSPKWVAGIEADAGHGNSGMTKHGIPGTFGNGVNACDPFGIACNGAVGIGAPGIEAEGVDSAQVKLGWDATIRGKLGMLITPTILFYGTGGVAFQQVSVSATCTDDGNFDSWCGFPPINKSQTFKSTRTGWTAGLGIEAVLSGNWIGKAEVRYADLGNVNNTFFAGTGDDFTTTVRLQTVTALAGVSYKFGAPGVVVAKY
jgi:opacity protein-like surface antigen